MSLALKAEKLKKMLEREKRKEGKREELRAKSRLKEVIQHAIETRQSVQEIPPTINITNNSIKVTDQFIETLYADVKLLFLYLYEAHQKYCKVIESLSVIKKVQNTNVQAVEYEQAIAQYKNHLMDPCSLSDIDMIQTQEIQLIENLLKLNALYPILETLSENFPLIEVKKKYNDVLHILQNDIICEEKES